MTNNEPHVFNPQDAERRMTTNAPYFAKELSWLSFNERVLQEAADRRNPVVERMHFLGIFSNNQDEFFKVRVADVRRTVKQEELEGRVGEASRLLSEIQDKIVHLSTMFDTIYQDVPFKHNKYILNRIYR